MQVIVVIGLVVICASVLTNGFLPLIIVACIGIYQVVTSKTAGEGIEFFFALCFFLGILALIIEVLT